MADVEQLQEPEIRDRTHQPGGVLPKNLKPYLYGGAVVLLLFATFISSRTKPAGANQPAKDAPPQPLVQDQTASNVAEMRNELAQEKQKEAQDAALAQSMASQNSVQQGAMQAYGADGRPLRPALPGQGDVAQQQPTPPDAAQAAASQLEAEEKKRIDNARFASNLVFTPTQEASRAPQPPLAATGEQGGPSSASASPVAAVAVASAPSRDQFPATAYKRPPEPI